MRTSAVPAIVGLICFWASAEILAQTPGEQLPAYIQLRRDVLVNSDLWSNQPEILAANLGFEGIIGIPGLRSADDLPLAAAAGAGVNLDWAQFAPVPPLRNLTTGAGPLGVELGGFGNSPILGDAMPIEVSWPLLPSSVQPDNIAITLNTGDVVTPVAAALNPNYDYNERHVIVTFGEFANRQTPGSAGAIYPVAVSFVDGCRRRSENVAPGGEWPSAEKRSAQMITCGSFFKLSEVPKSFELACRRRQGCSPTWISGLRFAVAF